MIWQKLQNAVKERNFVEIKLQLILQKYHWLASIVSKQLANVMWVVIAFCIRAVVNEAIHIIILAIILIIWRVITMPCLFYRSSFCIRSTTVTALHPAVRRPGFGLSATVVSAGPFSHWAQMLQCLWREMATCRHWSVSLWREPDGVPHCRVLAPGKAEWRLVSAVLCGWGHCFVAEKLWFMTRIREAEDCTVIPQRKVMNSINGTGWLL